MDSKIPQSNSAIKRQARVQNQGLRSFGGKLEGFVDNRERHFNQRMLKAYLKGGQHFRFGFDKDSGAPVTYKVSYTDKTVDADKLDALLANGYNDPGKVFGGVRMGKSELRGVIRKREQKAREAKLKPVKASKSILQRLGLGKAS